MVKKLGVDGVQKAFLSQDADGSGSVSRDELKERVFLEVIKDLHIDLKRFWEI